MNVSVRRLPLLPLLLLSAAALMVQPVLHAQSVATTPVGYNVLTCYSGGNMRVNTFVQPTAYQSTLASIVSGTVCNISSSGATLTSGSFAEVASKPVYYMEILSGSVPGLILDVVSNSATAITVSANLSSFALSGTESFCIRHHTTLASLFPSGCGLTAFADTLETISPSGADAVYTYSGSTGDGWSGSGSQIIYPGQGFILYVGGGATESVTIMGTVKPGPTIVPLYAGQYNLVGTINPVLSGAQTLSNFNFPASLAPFADSVEVFQDNGSESSVGVYTSNGSSMTPNGNTVTVNPSNAVAVVPGNTNEYYKMPSFYTSGN